MDIRAAISFVVGETNVDAQRVGIWGSSYGGGLVTWTAGNDPRGVTLIRLGTAGANSNCLLRRC